MIEAAIFGIDIGQEISDAIARLWQSVAYYLTLQFIDPFYYHLMVGGLLIAGIAAACWALNWFFPKWFEWTRPLAGMAIVVIASRLWGIWKGEKIAREHDQDRR